MSWEAYWLVSIESSTFHVSASDVILIVDFRKENCMINNYVVWFIQIISWYFDFISATENISLTFENVTLQN
jgi:hypothetical protein